ncbi:MAG: N-acetylmuramoyl-L-alanine amidase [Pigmentiphaga sp.]|nr:N-acetylmuramoyl-L-alanine amidase [Pigmentiphaga sp.]
MDHRTPPPSGVLALSDAASTSLQAPGRRRLLALASTLLVVPLVPRLAHAASIVAVRTWPAVDYTRVTLELDAQLKAEHFLLDNPMRLVVDLNGVDVSPQLRDLVSKVQPNDPYIHSVRVGQYQPGIVRMVFDLKQNVAPQVFTLKPIAEYQHRLVLDLYPTQAQDPLMALLGPDDDPLAKVIEELRGQSSAAPEPPKAVARTAPAGDRPSGGEGSVEATLRSHPTPTPRQRQRSRELVIMVDAGHGGEDPGAIGPGGTYEKNVVLAIAKRVHQRLNAQSGVRALLTRDGDYFVPLNTRVLKARQAQADLFISIHADAAPRRSANGASVYALSQRGASSTSARWLAQRENAADLIGGVNLGSQDQLIAKVLLDLSTTAQINDSIKLGTYLLGEITRINRLHKRQVEQAAFAVLRAPDIPSVLVETAFISNPEEERKLRTTRFQNQMADAIATGVQTYFARNPAIANTNLARR